MGLSTRAGPDGAFAVQRIMPGEPIWLMQVFSVTGRAMSEPMTLKPGETRRRGRLDRARPAYIRGIVVDEEDRPLERLGGVCLEMKHGGGIHYEGNRFMANGVIPDEPLRIVARADGFVPYRSPELLLKPGEMRFVKVVMKNATPKQPSPGGSR